MTVEDLSVCCDPFGHSWVPRATSVVPVVAVVTVVTVVSLSSVVCVAVLIPTLAGWSFSCSSLWL